MSKTQNIASRLMQDLQRDFDLSVNQAAAMVGNLMHESGGFESLQEIKPLIPGSRGGYGYAQWTGPRRRTFEKYAKQNGLDPSSYEANYGFLVHELRNDPYESSRFRKFQRDYRNADTDTAAKAFSDAYLRPGIEHLASRQKYAAQVAGLNSVAPLDRPPPQRPVTSLAAIEKLAPIERKSSQKMAYAPSAVSAGKSRVIPKKDWTDGLSLWDKLKLRNAGEYADSTQKGVTKVADAFGAFGQHLAGPIVNKFDEFNAPTPPIRNRAPKPVMSVSDVFKKIDYKAPTPPIRPQNFPSAPRNMARAEVGFVGPAGQEYTPQVPKPVVPKQIGPTPPMVPQGLQNQKLNPFQTAQRNVRQTFAPIRNVRHDIGGRMDGLKLAIRQAAMQQVQRLAQGRPSHMISLDRAASNGNFVHDNRYIYRDNGNGGYTQTGKVKNGQAKMWSDNREKPKGYTYFDQISGEWKEK